MRITGKTRRSLFIQNIIYYALLLVIAGLVSWLSVRYSTQVDWSASNRNSLSKVSREIAQKIDAPLMITAYIINDETTRSAIRNLISRYQRHNKNIQLEFVNPQTNPGQTREMNVNGMGELIIQYGEAQERLQQLTEETFTNVLQRLVRGEERWIVFLTGHGERDPYAQNDPGLSKFSERASQQGFAVQSLNLLVDQQIPDNTQVLVIASPRNSYLPGEIDIVLDYLRKGGNLLWLTEPENSAGMDTIEMELGIKRLPGVVVDSAGQIFGITQPDFIVVVSYPDSGFMRDFNEFTLFPQAVGLIVSAANPLGLTATTFLQTLTRSWTETGPIEGNIEFSENANEVAGPIDIGIRLTRTLEQTDAEDNKPAPSQRIAVIGDGDFLTNAYIGNGSNMLLGINIMNWLSHDEDLISIDAVSAPDTQLTLSSTYIIIVSFLFLIMLPLALIITGVVIWMKRRKK